jgi:hypothetical protein
MQKICLENPEYMCAFSTQSYSEKEHKNIFHEIDNCFSKVDKCAFMDSLYETIKCSCLNDGETPFIDTALQLSKLIKQNANIVELGANRGFISVCLQLMGHNVLCTDLHHGLLSKSINSYKVGTWLRENFVGLNAVDTFEFGKDEIKSLDVFVGGIDSIVTRGTGILHIAQPYAIKKAGTISRLICKFTRKGRDLQENNEYNVVLKNIMSLLEIINPDGILFFKRENVFGNFSERKRIEFLEKLVLDLSHFVECTYTMEEKHIHPDWRLFNVTLICKRKAQ